MDSNSNGVVLRIEPESILILSKCLTAESPICSFKFFLNEEVLRGEGNGLI